MKKEGLVVVLILAFALSATFAAAADEKVDAAYACLNSKVKDRCSELTLEEKAFTALAIGKCVSELSDSSKDGKCWPESGCNVRSTALSIMALKKNGHSTTDAEDWIKNQTSVPKDLVWFLEIDSGDATSCTISYKDKEYSVSIKEDKKISGSAGPCLSIDSAGFWFEIDDACYSTNFSVSCEKDFVTTLLYKKKSSSTVYVSTKTNFAPSQGKTTEIVKAVCFGSSSCDYEGSLWASIALAGLGRDVSSYLPYLIAMSQDNEKYFPYTFLYMLTDYDDYYSEIVSLQENDYWKITDSPYTQFYDTALALLSLQDVSSSEAESAKAYLLEVQDSDGCWKTVRDTAFILYAAWPRPFSTGPIEEDYCEDYDFYCVASAECETENLKTLPCKSGAAKVCCSVEAKEDTCEDKGGELCEGDEVCTDGREIEASDTTATKVCCRGGTCAVPQEPEDPECVQEGNFCRASCSDDEEEEPAYDCDSGDICCKTKEEAPSYWWIWLLVILIALVVVAILFKDRIRTFIFQMKNKKGPANRPSDFRRPPMSPPPASPMPPGVSRGRMILPSQARPQPSPQPRPQVRPVMAQREKKTDKELEDTLSKLKAMSGK